MSSEELGFAGADAPSSNLHRAAKAWKPSVRVRHQAPPPDLLLSDVTPQDGTPPCSHKLLATPQAFSSTASLSHPQSERQSVGYDSDRAVTPEACSGSFPTSHIHCNLSSHTSDEQLSNSPPLHSASTPWRRPQTLRPRGLAIPRPPLPESSADSSFAAAADDSVQLVSVEEEQSAPPPPLPVSVAALAGNASHGAAPLCGASASSDQEFGRMILAGLKSGRYTKSLHADSCGGTYWIRNEAGLPLAVFKPASEEIGQEGNPHGNVESDRDEFAPGTGYKREILAYALDHDGSAKVPQTIEFSFNDQLGSLQRFALHCTEAGNHLPGKFSVEEVQRIAVMDLRLLNGDRHGGNILVQQHDASPCTLVPIDHSYIIPTGFADPDFEWASWPQSKAAFEPSVVQYVAQLDADKDYDIVMEILGDEDAAEMVKVATTALKIAVDAGYTARDIAAFFRRETLTQPSRLEIIIGQCRQTLDNGGMVDMARFTRAICDSFPRRK